MKYNTITIQPFHKSIKKLNTRHDYETGDYTVIGGDTETCDGYPITLQFERAGSSVIMPCNGENATERFLVYCEHLRSLEIPHPYIFVHNLKFDMISFFYDNKEKFTDEEFLFDVGAWNVRGIYAGCTFGSVTHVDGYKITLIDTFAFFKSSLEKLARLYCPELPKLTRPKDLGQYHYMPGSVEWYDFQEYAMRDAEIALVLGQELIRRHREYGISMSVSAPSMAAKIFRRDFVKETICTPPNIEITQRALLSYHGGRNGLYVAPGYYKNVNAYDINSAYPWAMTQILGYTAPKSWMQHTIKKSAQFVDIASHGIYEITCTLIDVDYPILYDENFKLASGAVKNLLITGVELMQAIKIGEINTSKRFIFRGTFYTPATKKEYSAVKNYAESLYKKRLESTDKIDTDFYKLLLNSLYGKFVQTFKEREDIIIDDQDYLSAAYDLTSGGLFHPEIASLITAIVRVELNRLEIKYKAMHSATDSIFTQKKIDKSDAKTGLGGLKLEYTGDLLIVRNKLYIFYGDEPLETTSQKSTIYPNKYINKYALHGFRGTPHDLELIVSGEKSEYTYTRCNTLKDSLNRGLVVNKFESQTATLKLEK